MQTDEENRIVYRSVHTLLGGIVRLESDQLCVQFDGYFPNVWLCGAIYRTDASRDARVDYVEVLPDGLRYFSVKD